MQKGTLTETCRAAFTEPGDGEFLEQIIDRFPRVGDKFASLAAKAPHNRHRAAVAMLKETPRQGWLDRLVPPEKVESVHDHIFHCMKLASLMAEPEDIRHLVALMRAHDLAEAATGDFTPRDKITKPEKHRLERIALNLILEGSSDKKEIIGLWQEFERNETPAAKLGHDIDYIDMALTAQGYIRAYPHLAAVLHNEFVVYTENYIKTATGRAFFDSIKDPPPPGLDKPAARP
jgi:5'-deoxynucleotidase YfbR-like HD superfamily hydrolase